MARKSATPEASPGTDRSERDGSAVPSATVGEVLEQVKQLLDSGQPKKAIERIGRANDASAWLINAVAVCQLRLGNAQVAMETLRGLVVQGSIHLRDDAPAAFKLNFAVALLALGNLDGFLSALNEIGDDEHPSARKYREADRHWKANLTLGDRIKMIFGGSPARPFALDFPPGELT
jgi:hypothetical protein